MSEAWQTAICIAFDAMRLCLGMRPARYGTRDVMLWLRCMEEARHAD